MQYNLDGRLLLSLLELVECCKRGLINISERKKEKENNLRQDLSVWGSANLVSLLFFYNKF